MPRYYVGTYPFVGTEPYVKLSTDNFNEAKSSYGGTGNYTACIYDSQNNTFLETKTGTNFNILDTTPYLEKLQRFILDMLKE